MNSEVSKEIIGQKHVLGKILSKMPKKFRCKAQRENYFSAGVFDTPQGPSGSPLAQVGGKSEPPLQCKGTAHPNLVKPSFIQIKAHGALANPELGMYHVTVIPALT